MQEDIIVSVDSWEYLVDFMVLQPKANLGGYPLILGRPWLATVDAYIGCKSGDMTISHENSTKKLTLYPPTKPSPNLENSSWVEHSDEEPTQPLLTLAKDSTFKNAIEDDFICTYLAHPHIFVHIWHSSSFAWDYTDMKGIHSVAFLIHTCKREQSPAHLVCPWRHNA